MLMFFFLQYFFFNYDILIINYLYPPFFQWAFIIKLGVYKCMHVQFKDMK